MSSHPLLVTQMPPGIQALDRRHVGTEGAQPKVWAGRDQRGLDLWVQEDARGARVRARGGRVCRHFLNSSL
jgi:hypothetical protein